MQGSATERRAAVHRGGTVFNDLSIERYQLSPGGRAGGCLSNKNKKKTSPCLLTITMAKFHIGQEGREGKETEKGVERGKNCHEPGCRFLLNILIHLMKYYDSHLQMRGLRLQLANR